MIFQRKRGYVISHQCRPRLASLGTRLVIPPGRARAKVSGCDVWLLGASACLIHVSGNIIKMSFSSKKNMLRITGDHMILRVRNELFSPRT